MSISYVECGPINDVELSQLHSLAFGGAQTAEVTAWTEQLRAHSVGWVCAFDGSQLCGFVHACWDGGRHAFVLDTAVHPDYQRQGIATELLQRQASLARDAGCDWLHVDYEPHLDDLYRSTGFAPTLAGLRKLN